MLFDLHVRLVDPLVAPALLAPFLFWNTATAEEGNSFLADRHVSRGVQCQSCHTESGKLKEYKEFLMFPCVNYPRVFTYLNRSSTF